MEFFKLEDYPRKVFERAYRRQSYLKIRCKVKSIAVYKSGGGLGDLVQSSVLFANLRRMFPEAKIIYLGLYQRPRCDNLFASIPYIDEYIEYRHPKNLNAWVGYFSFFKKYFTKFDLIIDTQSKFIPSLCLWFLKPKYLLSRNPFFSNWIFMFNKKAKFHVVSKMLSCLRLLGFEQIDFNPVNNISIGNLIFAKTYLNNFSGPFICLISGAGHPYKIWPKDKVVALADKLQSMGYRVVLAGAQTEKRLLLEIAQMMHSKPIVPLLDEPGFGRDPIYSLGLFKLSVLTIGCDCGGLHLATLAGCPVIGIYGPTHPSKSGPLGERNIVIHKGLKCSPCRLRDCKINRKCFADINVDDVVKAARFILK